MRLATIHLGTTPAEEPCAQTGVTLDWLQLQQVETQVYRAALIARYGPPPPSTHLVVTTSDHDFGRYAELVVSFAVAELVVSFAVDDPAGAAYADEVEGGLDRWMAAGFIGPVDYDDDDGSPVTRRSAEASIVAAIVLARRLIANGYGTEREHSADTHLSAAYPTCAQLAADKIAALRPV